MGSVVGKPYSLTVSKLARRNSAEAAGYFCSELVAEGLKVLKVLPRGKSSTQFWPSTFEARNSGRLETLPGTSFGDELVIDFRLDPDMAHVGTASAAIAQHTAPALATKSTSAL